MKKEPFELESWIDPETDEQFVKIRKWTKDGAKLGIILIVRDNALFELSEEATYPKLKLKSIRKDKI